MRLPFPATDCNPACVCCVCCVCCVWAWYADVTSPLYSPYFANEANHISIISAKWASEVFFPPQDCIGSDLLTTYAYALLFIWLPSCVIASVVWPLWMLSLQLATVLAADDVDDLMKMLDPLTSTVDFSGPAGSEGARRWQTRVELPAAMLVTTLEELSTWGPSMGTAIVAMTVTALCLIPTAVATNSHSMLLALGLLQGLPAFIALAPATVSSTCDDMLDQ